MSAVIDFLGRCAKDRALAAEFNERSLPEVVFHARVMGYRFSAEELTKLVGGMEWNIITKRMGEEMNAYSSLWPKMWGKPRFQYVVEELVSAFTSDELRQLV